MTKENIAAVRNLRPKQTKSRYEYLRKTKSADRTHIENAELFVFRHTMDAKKAMDASRVALRLLDDKILKVKNDCRKIYPKISGLKEEIDNQILKGSGTIKLSRELSDFENERQNKEDWVDRQEPALADANSLILLRVKEFEEKVREAQFMRKCLGVYRQAFTDAYEQIYLATIEAKKAIIAISHNFTPIDDIEIGEIVNGSDWLNENYARENEASDIFYGEDRTFGIWEKVVNVIVEDENRARMLNEKEFPPTDTKKLPPKPTGKEKPMLNQSRTMILKDSQTGYPDSKINADRILAQRQEQGENGELADFEG